MALGFRKILGCQKWDLAEVLGKVGAASFWVATFGVSREPSGHPNCEDPQGGMVEARVVCTAQA